MLADSAASKLRTKVRNMSPQELASEDGLREVARLEAHNKAKAEAAAANGVTLRTTGLKRAINARLEDIARAVCTWRKTEKSSFDSDEIWGWQKLRKLDYSEEQREHVKRECMKKGWVWADPLFPKDENENFYYVLLECKATFNNHWGTEA